MQHTIGLTHTFDAAHRVVGHEGGTGKCARLHGHTYTVEVELSADELDHTGFVVDFGVVKRLIDEWDHRTLLWDADVLAHSLGRDGYSNSLVVLPFNPTAENMARHLADKFGECPAVNAATVTVRETAKTWATYTWRCE